MGTRAASAPEFLLRPGSTGRIGKDYKTQYEFNGGRTQGEEQRERSRRRQRTPKLCRTRARRIHRDEIVTITFEPPRGVCEEREGFFYLAVSHFKWRTSVPHITLALIPTANGGASEAVALPQIGAAGGAA